MNTKTTPNLSDRKAKILRACELVMHADLALAADRPAIRREIEALKAEIGCKRLIEVADFVNGQWVVKESK